MVQNGWLRTRGVKLVYLSNNMLILQLFTFWIKPFLPMYCFNILQTKVEQLKYLFIFIQQSSKKDIKQT